MTTYKILLTDGLDATGKSILRDVATVDDKSGISADDLLKIIPDYDALIVRGRTKVTASVMDAAARLKVIGRAGVGKAETLLLKPRPIQLIIHNIPNLTGFRRTEPNENPFSREQLGRPSVAGNLSGFYPYS
jgi:D-3-phosphoglycerate dehydrogenase / 2-oxoglutarate reductase